jgi:hypothetical protein
VIHLALLFYACLIATTVYDRRAMTIEKNPKLTATVKGAG